MAEFSTNRVLVEPLMCLPAIKSNSPKQVTSRSIVVVTVTTTGTLQLRNNNVHFTFNTVTPSISPTISYQLGCDDKLKNLKKTIKKKTDE